MGGLAAAKKKKTKSVGEAGEKKAGSLEGSVKKDGGVIDHSLIK